MDSEKVAVIGAGVIGTGLAVDLAVCEYEVLLIDLTDEILRRAEGTMRSDLRMYRMVIPGYREIDEEKLLGRICFSTELTGTAEAGLVIENITEDLNAKAALYEQLAGICREGTLLGVNTSCLSITKLAAPLPDPSRMIGMHFMNPVPMKKMVEMIRGELTSDATVADAAELVRRLRKEPVLVEDMPGFVANRVMMLAINECAFVLQDGVADAAAVDKIFRLGFGHKMGPLATADLIGLDTVLDSIKVLHSAYGDSKYRPCPLLQKMVDAGYLGRKCGRGFFSYGGRD